MRVRDYGGPLGVLAAGVVGFSMLCSVSAMAMSDLNNYIPATLQPLNIMDLAFSNLSTAAALTEQAVTQFVPTPTVVPTNTASLTPQPSNTSVVIASITPREPTRTRRPRSTPTSKPPMRTNTPAPTSTPVPTFTPTPVPTSTDTPVPTNTLPPPTPTDVPPTATDVPPTNTPIPPDTPTEPPVQMSGLTDTPMP